MSFGLTFKKIGSVQIDGAATLRSLLFSSLQSLSYSSPYYSEATFKKFGLNYNGSTFNSSTLQTFPGNYIKAFPTAAGSFSYQADVGSSYRSIFFGVPGNIITLAQSTNNNLIYGYDSNESYFAYSAHAQGTTTSGTSYNEKYLLVKFAQFDQVLAKAGVNSSIDFVGDVSISQNSLYSVVFGDFNSLKNIAIYFPSGGAYKSVEAGSASLIKIGQNIAIPESSLIDVKINNSGNRLVYSTINSVGTYSLVSGNWVQQSTISGLNSPKISINADGSILSVREPFSVKVYKWNNELALKHSIDIQPPEGYTTYYGNQVAFTPDASYLAFDIWDTPSSKKIEIYKNQSPTSVRVGSTPATSVYYGLQKLWPDAV